jgi:[ribosomal protein S18]-alanine N-acetyltransferase
MVTEEDLTISLTTSPEDFSVCAAMMSATDPWISLKMNRDLCMMAFDGPCKEIYVIRVQNYIAGFIIIQTGGTFSGYIQTICIGEKYRGRQLGTKLLQFAEKRILKFSPNVFICVSSFNKGAIKLYYEFGFKLIGKLDNFVRDGFDELLLRKTIGPRVGYQTNIKEEPERNTAR